MFFHNTFSLNYIKQYHAPQKLDTAERDEATGELLGLSEKYTESAMSCLLCLPVGCSKVLVYQLFVDTSGGNREAKRGPKLSCAPGPPSGFIQP